MLPKLEELLRSGDIHDFSLLVERAKRIGLTDEVARLEKELELKRSEVSQCLTRDIQDWKADRVTIERSIEEAKRVGLDDLVSSAEAAMAAKKKQVADGLDLSVVEGLRSRFIQWINRAKKMGMDEVVMSNEAAFQEKTEQVRQALVAAAECGTRQEFLLASEKARSIGLLEDTKHASGVVRKRVSDLLEVAAGLATDMISSGLSHRKEWDDIRLHAKRLEVEWDVIEHFVKDVLEAVVGEDESEALIASCWTKQDVPCFDPSVQATERPGGDGPVIPIWSMMQNWGEAEMLRRRWEGQIAGTNLKPDFSQSLVYRAVASAAEGPVVDKRTSGREQPEYESDAEDRLPRTDENAVIDPVLSMPLILTPPTIEQRLHCSRTQLQRLAKLDLSNEGLTSLGEGVIAELCPKTKVFTCDMNRLTTLKGAFSGCDGIEHISAKNNFLSGISGLGSLLNLETLRLDGNNLSVFGTSQQQGTCNHSLPKPPRTLSCWSRLKELSLSCNRIVDITMLSRLCPSLQSLDLGSNHLVTLDDFQGNALAGLKFLRVLDVGQNRLKGQSLWEGLKHCPLLTSLVASRNRLTELPSYSGTVLLRELWLNGNAIKRLSCSAWMPNLQRLYLQDNSIETLEPLWGCPALEVLDLSFNSISDLSQLRQLACFLHLRTLQLNDNPVSEQGDYADTVFEVVPWLLELDNEAVTDRCKNRVIKRLFLKVMTAVGAQYYQEKAARSELIVSGSGDMHILISCGTQRRIPWFHRVHSDTVHSAAGHCQIGTSCSDQHLVPFSAFRRGTADRAILWAALFEVSLFDATRTELRSLLQDSSIVADGRGLLFSDDLEAKQNLFAIQEMCSRQRDKLLLSNKDLTMETETLEAEGTCTEFSRAELTSGGSSRQSTDDLETCLEQHLHFSRHRALCKWKMDNKDLAVSRLQAVSRGYLTRLKLQRSAKAACNIQTAWRGRKLRSKLSFPDSESRKAGIALLVKVQALWRGYAFRLKYRNALARSKYVDEDKFEYEAINEEEFIPGVSTVEQLPGLFVGPESRGDQFSSLFAMPTEQGFVLLCHDQASRFDVKRLNTAREDCVNQTEVNKKIQLTQIAQEWGFKDEKTVKQFMKACNKGRKKAKALSSPGAYL